MTEIFKQLDRENIMELDLPKVDEYNRKAKPDYFLHAELGPMAFEGDLENARVALLLSNPGYGAGSTSDSLTFHRQGWPLSGIHPEAPAGSRKWQLKLLRHLIKLVGDQATSQRVVKLELNPWASVSFDRNLRLPSRQLVLNAAAELARRGVPLIVMRSERLWLEEEVIANSPNRYRVNSWLSASISPTNLSPAAWSHVSAAIRA